MLLPHIIQTRYTLLKRKKKIKEQLEIGKIKFEITPVYANNKCIASIPNIKYNSLNTSGIGVVDTYRSNFVKTILMVCVLFIIATSVISVLESLGLYVSSNNEVIKLVTPCIFPDITPELTPHLSLLLSKSNFLTL